VRFGDLLSMALGALFQQKVRTLLTTFGVLIGTFTLVLSISLGQGVYYATMYQVRHGNQLREIEVSPGYGHAERVMPAAELEVQGQMSEDKRERIRKLLVRDWLRNNPQFPQVPLDQEKLRQLASLDHVESVVPYLVRSCRARLGSRAPLELGAMAVAPANAALQQRIVAGEGFSSADEHAVLVHEYVLYRLGIRDDADVERVVGRKLRLEYHTNRPRAPDLLALLGGNQFQLNLDERKLLDKAVRGLPAARDRLKLSEAEMLRLHRILGRLTGPTASSELHVWTADFTIVGVVREPMKGDEGGFGISRFAGASDLFLPAEAAEAFFWQSPAGGGHHVQWATVTVDDDDHLREVVAQIEGLGLQQWSLVEFADRVRGNMVLLAILMTFLATVALLVAALGITNTMFMSVLERTREIGIMKAVGARNRHIQVIFLVEGALIGAVGGGLGLLLSWAASFPGDGIARSIMERQTGAPPHQTLFLFPFWLTLGAPLFATLVTTLAAYYPARRASRVNPITALRHE
jgi:putative ABC transport system permease protein